jgi:hypothetical protein
LSLKTLYVSLRPDSLPGESESLSRLTWFGKTPLTVLEALGSKALKPIDVCVYSTIALDAENCIPVQIGNRLIAKVLGISQSVVTRSIQRLIKTGHIVKRPTRIGERAVYEMNSLVFMEVDRRPGGVVILTGYSGIPKHIGVVPEPSAKPRAPKKTTAATA